MTKTRWLDLSLLYELPEMPDLCVHLKKHFTALVRRFIQLQAPFTEVLQNLKAFNLHFIVLKAKLYEV